MCDRCNPLGLKQPAPSQAHGTVLLAIVVAAPPGLAVTVTVENVTGPPGSGRGGDGT
jgi:hypothetical protein